MLLRSGVGRLRLVDFDQVTLSSLNRHAVAVRADVGISKASCLERHFREILPEVGRLGTILCIRHTLCSAVLAPRAQRQHRQHSRQLSCH